ncbi:hypothetical protein AB833_12790 [Chromatiales bacterium (ex Bugula neritina AB1)]|nr:hypothetical protein AB833_12790 [Chromatiales bacterium (ex Bugula neritina AB1)]
MTENASGFNADAGSLSAELRRKILAGEYRHDERLPAERSLARQFGCSRGTVRSAMEKLEELKLIERRVGSGTFVNHHATADETEIANITSPLELIDVRMGMEPQIARLAVINATAVNLRKLENSLLELENLPADCSPESFTVADQSYHLALAECTGNALMIWLCQHIHEVRSHRQWSSMKDKILKPAQIRIYNRQHRSIYEAIVSRDIETAEQATIEHLETARNDLIGAAR